MEQISIVQKNDKSLFIFKNIIIASYVLGFISVLLLYFNLYHQNTLEISALILLPFVIKICKPESFFNRRWTYYGQWILNLGSIYLLSFASYITAIIMTTFVIVFIIWEKQLMIFIIHFLLFKILSP